MAQFNDEERLHLMTEENDTYEGGTVTIATEMTVLSTRVAMHPDW